MLGGVPVVIGEPLQVDRLVRLCPLYMKYGPLDLHTHFGCRRNISAKTENSVRVYSEES
jgi:hypothetical protein